MCLVGAQPKSTPLRVNRALSKRMSRPENSVLPKLAVPPENSAS